MLRMLGREPQALLLRKTLIAMAMHRFVSPGVMGRTSTRCGLTPLVSLNNPLNRIPKSNSRMPN